MTDEAFELKPAVPADHGAIAALHEACFPDEPWNEASIDQVMALEGAFGLLAWRGGRLGGFVLVRVVLQECEILALGVAPTWRRSGLGRALLRAAAAQLPLLGVEVMHLEVAEDNRAACALYDAEGFHRVGRRPGYYRRAGTAAVAAILYSCQV
ncbi:MAG: GNAT family N-acetyltransferase [Pseudomonadota bacterium]